MIAHSIGRKPTGTYQRVIERHLVRTRQLSGTPNAGPPRASRHRPTSRMSRPPSRPAAGFVRVDITTTCGAAVRPTPPRLGHRRVHHPGGPSASAARMLVVRQPFQPIPVGRRVTDHADDRQLVRRCEDRQLADHPRAATPAPVPSHRRSRRSTIAGNAITMGTSAIVEYARRNRRCAVTVTGSHRCAVGAGRPQRVASG